MNPDGLAALGRADDYEQVKAVAEYYAEYAALFDGSGNNPGDKTLEDKFFEHEVSSFVVSFLNIVWVGTDVPYRYTEYQTTIFEIKQRYFQNVLEIFQRLKTM